MKFTARVRGGRLVLDEPTDLPEGTELPLYPKTADELEEEKEIVRKVLLGLKDAQEGELSDDSDVWAEVEGQLQAAEKPGAD